MATVLEHPAPAPPQAPRSATLNHTMGALDPDAPQVRRILERIRATPEGFVRTYGDCSPGAPRMAGAVLAAELDPGLPWHRIVRADGTLAQGERQRALLENEGIPFNGHRVDLRIARFIDS